MANLILRWFDDISEFDFSKPERYAADVSRGVEYAGASRPAAEAEYWSLSPPPSPLDDDDDAPTSTPSLLSPAMGDRLGEDCARESDDGAVRAADCCAINDDMSKGI